MDLRRLLDELALAARRLGVEVRFEPFEPGLREAQVPRGSLCTIHGRRCIVVDADAPIPERVALLASALAELDHESLYLSPVARATIRIYQRSAPHAAASSLMPLPLARTKRPT